MRTTRCPASDKKHIMTREESAAIPRVSESARPDREAEKCYRERINQNRRLENVQTEDESAGRYSERDGGTLYLQAGQSAYLQECYGNSECFDSTESGIRQVQISGYDTTIQESALGDEPFTIICRPYSQVWY